MRWPLEWNRSRATALGTTLVLHVAAVLWLLALRFDLPEKLAGDLEILWQSLPVTAPIQPATSVPPVDASLPPAAAPSTAVPSAVRPPVVAYPITPPDEEGWRNFAKDAARQLTTSPSWRPFGEVPKGPAKRPVESYEPSIFDQPLPRVGKTVETPDGETILWVSDNCYVSLSSRSLTQGAIHEGRRGARMCNFAVGHKEARGDLFDPLKRLPPPSEPGCNKDGIGLSCSR
jgi:hypothetical protein